MLFKEVIADYSETTETKKIQNAELRIIKTGGAYNSH
jgi:hypothetical protein